jgi:hypothetical protein
MSNLLRLRVRDIGFDSLAPLLSLVAVVIRLTEFVIGGLYLEATVGAADDFIEVAGGP